jgi:FkbM family methyltransferase
MPVHPRTFATLHRLRHLVRRARWAGDLRTLRRLYRPTPGLQPLTIRFAGQRCRFWVRGGTIDASLAEMIIREDSEYRLPVDLAPGVIFDAGANIGATSVYFALRYPNARIFAFEPLPENLDVLHRNLEPFSDRATIIPMGLGERPGTFTYHYSDDPYNLGGGTFYRIGCDRQRSVRLPVTTIADVCQRLEIDRIDLLKLDAEGAEFDILRGMSPDMLGEVRAIVGELHSVRDWDACRLLDPTHQLGMSKRFDRACYPFVAIRRPTPPASPCRLAA